MTLQNIGSFAVASGLSIAALRHYDDIGLLKPAQVDPGTGYRRYATSQLEKARLICGLRAIDLPIDEIRAVLDRPAADVRAALDAHRERMVVQMRDLAQRVTAVDEFIAAGTAMPVVAQARPVQLWIAPAPPALYTEAFDAVYLDEIDSLRFGAYRSQLFFLVTMAADAPAVRFGLLVPDVDRAHERAVAAGFTEQEPPAEFSYKPRTSTVRDPGGNLVDVVQD